jgi:two-component system sensor histidine kinase RegB
MRLTDLERRFPRLLLPIQEPRIVLVWLSRLRWLAVVGQIAAVAAAVGGLGLHLPLAPIAALIGLTFLTNLIILLWMKARTPPAFAVPAVLVMDVLLLTGLLYLTGGPANPFAILYLVHVTIAVVALGAAWTWGVVMVAAISYGLLLRHHVPLGPLPANARHAGNWIALVLVSALIAYFVSRVTRALRGRERELELLRIHAQRNEQLAALTTLAAGAAHELGTPLGTIAIVAREIELAAEGVLKAGSGAARGGAAAGTGGAGGSTGEAGCPAAGHIVEDALLIRQQVDRCRAILERMRVDLGEEGGHGAEPVALGEILGEVVRELPDARQPRLVIEGNVSSGLFIGPARAIQQALGVLIGNAFDATAGPEPVTLAVVLREGRLIFTVRDRGMGMDAETVRRAGEPFFTTKPPGQGMGLGLYLVRLVAERYGGRLHLESAPGQGTSSTLELEARQVLVGEGD